MEDTDPFSFTAGVGESAGPTSGGILTGIRGGAGRGRPRGATTASKGAKAAGKRAPTQSQVTADVAARAGVTKAEVAVVFAALAQVTAENLKRDQASVIPGLAKIRVAVRAATKAREGRRPGTNEMMMYKAKPATRVVRLRALKALKEMA